LNNHKVTLSFRPATQSDEQTLASFYPSGEVSDISQFPTTIPSYLINVVPEIAVDGTVTMTSAAMPLGENVTLVFQLKRVGQSVDTKSYDVPAGSYLSIGVVSENVSPSKVTALRSKIDDTRAILGSGDRVAIGALTRDDLLGDLFYSGVLAYFGQYIAIGDVARRAINSQHGLGAGFGSYGYEPYVDSFFGIPRRISAGGVAYNIWIGGLFASNDGDRNNQRDLTFQMGVLSSVLEHAVPEQMFTRPQSPVDGVSAVKALSIAMTSGQKIFTITQQNQAQVLPQLRQDSLTMSEIRSALSVGKSVIAHVDQIEVPGWRGAGYILYDPDTGNGAFKISGGLNGGQYAGDNIKDLFQGTIDFFGLLYELIGLKLASWAAELADLTLTLLDAWTNCSAFWAKWLTFFTIAFTVVGILSSIAIGIAFGAFWGIILGFVFSYILVDMYIELVIERRCG
jgi:hypothetical protein